MNIEAMKQALEALEEVQGHMNTSDWFNERVNTLRTAIEQAEKQEPVAYSIGRTLHWHEGRGVNDAQLYTPPAPAAPVQEECVVCGDKVRVIPRPWVGLTPDEVFSIADQHPVEGFDPDIMAYTSAIEQRLKEKNT